MIYQGLLMLCGSLPACAPYVACWLVVVLSGWMLAVRSLGRQFNRKIVEQGLDDVAVRPARRGEALTEVPV
jgi:ATP/ADP translocase